MGDRVTAVRLLDSRGKCTTAHAAPRISEHPLNNDGDHWSWVVHYIDGSSLRYFEATDKLPGGFKCSTSLRTLSPT